MDHLIELIFKKDALKIVLLRPLEANDFSPVLEELNNIMSFISEEEALKFEESGKKMYAHYKISFLYRDDLKKAILEKADPSTLPILNLYLSEVYKVHKWEISEVKTRTNTFEKFQEKIKSMEEEIVKKVYEQAVGNVSKAISSLNIPYFKKYGIL